MIKPLPKSRFKDHPLAFAYETDVVYEVVRDECEHETTFRFTLKTLEKPVKKAFEAKLYPEYFQHAEAYGYDVEGVLAGVIEINHEPYNNRVRITECIVFDAFRRRGIGRRLIEHAVQRAKALRARALILETQTSNVAAIRFYRTCGFSLMGTDLTAYSNEDVERDEVRVEFARCL